jgi:hypothetical protein
MDTNPLQKKHFSSRMATPAHALDLLKFGQEKFSAVKYL